VVIKDKKQVVTEKSLGLIQLPKFVHSTKINKLNKEFVDKATAIIDAGADFKAKEFLQLYYAECLSALQESPTTHTNTKMYFMSELLFKGFGFQDSVFSFYKEQAHEVGFSFDLDGTGDFGIIPSCTSDFILKGERACGEMETKDYNAIIKSLSSFYEYVLTTLPEGALVVFPYDIEQLRMKSLRYFDRSKKPKMNRHALFVFGDKYFVSTNNAYEYSDNLQSRFEFTYTMRTLKAISGCLNKKDISIDTVSKNVMANCSLRMPTSFNNVQDVRDFFKSIKQAVVCNYIALDTETKGLNPNANDSKLLTIQIATSATHAFLVPFDSQYGVTDDMRAAIVSEMNALLDDNIGIYFNQSFEARWFQSVGIVPRQQYHDVQLLMKEFNRNVTATLTHATKLYAPEIAGYSDVFDNAVDKSRMEEVPLSDMVYYACGDVIATYRTAYFLLQEVSSFGANYQMYKIKTRIQYSHSLFLEGTPHAVNMKKASELVGYAKKIETFLRKKLLKLVPKHMKAKALFKGMGRGSEKGSVMKLEPNEFGGSLLGVNIDSNTFKMELFYDERALNLKEKLPKGVEASLKSSEALYYLRDEEYVKSYLALQKVTKVLSTYLGDPEDEDNATGLLGKAIKGLIDVTYNIAFTNTGRSNASPNMQNIPNKTAISKFIRYALDAPSMKVDSEESDFVFVANDYSQIEVRLAAIQSMDENLLDVYKEGRDVYASVAAGLREMSYDEFKALPKDEYKYWRQRAKAVVLGFLYGMQAKGFLVYAETTFGIVMTLEEAQTYRTRFFNMFPKLANWHKNCERVGREYGYMTCPLGTYHIHENATIKANHYNAKQSSAVRNLINSPIQGLGAFLCMWAGALITEGMVKAGITDMFHINYVHDDQKYMVPKDKWKTYAGWVQWQMNHLPIKEHFGIEFPIPMTTSCEVGTNYAEMKEVEVEQIVPPWVAAA